MFKFFKELIEADNARIENLRKETTEQAVAAINDLDYLEKLVNKYLDFTISFGLTGEISSLKRRLANSTKNHYEVTERQDAIRSYNRFLEQNKVMLDLARKRKDEELRREHQELIRREQEEEARKMRYEQRKKQNKKPTTVAEAKATERQKVVEKAEKNNFGMKDLQVSLVEKECDYIILALIAERIDESKLEELIENISVLFPYIKKYDFECQANLKRYKGFKFQDKMIEKYENGKKVKVLKPYFKDSMTARCYSIFGLLSDEDVKLSLDFAQALNEIMILISDSLSHYN